MKTTIFFSSLAVAAGITLVELLMFFAYYRHQNQFFITETMKTAAKKTSDMIKNEANTMALPIEQIYAYSKYMSKIGQAEKEEVLSNHNTIFVKTIMGIFVLSLALLATYMIVPRNVNVFELTVGIVIGIISGSMLQYLFVTNIIPMYKGASTESLLYYTYNKIREIVDIC